MTGHRPACPPIPADVYTRLERRIGRCHLNQRLGIEHDFEARIFGQGRTFFHIENWNRLHTLLRRLLKLSLLYRPGQRAARRIEIRRNEFTLPHLPEAFEGYTLLHISDLHLDMAGDLPDALIRAIGQAGHYDACVLTGDFRARTFGPYRGAIDGLAQVRTHIDKPVFAILGNHDTIRMTPEIEDLGIGVLLNEAREIRQDGASIFLAGVDDPHYYRADNIEKAADPIPQGAVSILLSHSPELYRHAAYADFDIMLCGHTHGGQICLPGGIALTLNARCPRAFGRGYWRYHRMQGYTSAGSGVSILDIRLNCPPEITLHRLSRHRLSKGGCECGGGKG
ncbi:metallophosphoesterase [Methylococcus capsulatus]|uniref:Ser/Thr protein phosphatase family protein n=2 Tax=Methylococcus capsulatus TaxID=414 RepID=Q60CB1_METCA|nr:metallophosphoesterase [Methylococcus capsulatus]AAU90686.1 Ser/Thr protein phosphatase family protein [Methylococcus capsulatus str. Bath]QXP86314.1 metallophosphoesterase family protein [Methylococcus capsulatus]QXP89663.1 metallophosphoesterase family protein [Methylococcus capsulatus]QXP94015.1 metallophosphoesterase family protein [Methylococcus capsulatus]UQN11250.1 metallophosphoesterase [Methylococcus capsulatus]